MRSRNLRLVVLFLVAFALKGCGTQTGNGLVNVEFAPFGGRSAWYSLVRPAYAAVSSATFCFKRIRFKTLNESTTVDPNLDPDNLDFAVGEVTLSAGGTALGDVSVPPGTYERVEFDLEKDCGSGKSVQVSNSAGNFSTDSTVTVKFQGNFVVASGSETLSLMVDNIVAALDTVAADNEIKSKVEAASGSF